MRSTAIPANQNEMAIFLNERKDVLDLLFPSPYGNSVHHSIIEIAKRESSVQFGCFRLLAQMRLDNPTFYANERVLVCRPTREENAGVIYVVTEDGACTLTFSEDLRQCEKTTDTLFHEKLLSIYRLMKALNLFSAALPAFGNVYVNELYKALKHKNAVTELDVLASIAAGYFNTDKQMRTLALAVLGLYTHEHALSEVLPPEDYLIVLPESKRRSFWDQIKLEVRTLTHLYFNRPLFELSRELPFNGAGITADDLYFDHQNDLQPERIAAAKFTSGFTTCYQEILSAFTNKEVMMAAVKYIENELSRFLQQEKNAEEKRHDILAVHQHCKDSVFLDNRGRFVPKVSKKFKLPETDGLLRRFFESMFESIGFSGEVAIAMGYLSSEDINFLHKKRILFKEDMRALGTTLSHGKYSHLIDFLIMYFLIINKFVNLPPGKTFADLYEALNKDQLKFNDQSELYSMFYWLLDRAHQRNFTSPTFMNVFIMSLKDIAPILSASLIVSYERYVRLNSAWHFNFDGKTMFNVCTQLQLICMNQFSYMSELELSRIRDYFTQVKPAERRLLRTDQSCSGTIRKNECYYKRHSSTRVGLFSSSPQDSVIEDVFNLGKARSVSQVTKQTEAESTEPSAPSPQPG